MGWEGGFGGVLVAAARTQLHDSLDKNVQRLQLFPNDVLRYTPTQVLHQTPHTVFLCDGEDVESHTFLPSRDRSALTTALKPSEFDSISITFSPFSWAI